MTRPLEQEIEIILTQRFSGTPDRPGAGGATIKSATANIMELLRGRSVAGTEYINIGPPRRQASLTVVSNTGSSESQP